MAVKKEFFFPSVSGLADIHACSFFPEDKERVKAVYINDHLGHGKSVKNDDELGYFGEKDGWKNFIDDCHQLMQIAKKENPGKPYIFFGHSMGSFVAREFTKCYAEKLSGAVFCGTAGPNPAAGAGIAVAKLIGKTKGSHYRSKFIDNLAFGTYNKQFEGRTNFDWLTRDNNEVDKYIADKYCGFLFTAYGYRDMFSLLSRVSSKKWAEEYSKKLPVLLISGSKDPVGANGKGVEKVFNMLKDAGKNNVTMHLYEDARHEILNESKCFDKVCKDVIDWADSVL